MRMRDVFRWMNRCGWHSHELSDELKLYCAVVSSFLSIQFHNPPTGKLKQQRFSHCFLVEIAFQVNCYCGRIRSRRREAVLETEEKSVQVESGNRMKKEKRPLRKTAELREHHSPQSTHANCLKEEPTVRIEMKEKLQTTKPAVVLLGGGRLKDLLEQRRQHLNYPFSFSITSTFCSSSTIRIVKIFPFLLCLETTKSNNISLTT